MFDSFYCFLKKRKQDFFKNYLQTEKLGLIFHRGSMLPNHPQFALFFSPPCQFYSPSLIILTISVTTTYVVESALLKDTS